MKQGLESIKNKDRVRIEVNQEQCRACCMCVLMCSFHFEKVFSRELSSIEVLVDNTTGNVEWKVNSSCDLCKGEENYLCVKYCPYNCLYIKEVKNK